MPAPPSRPRPSGFMRRSRAMTASPACSLAAPPACLPRLRHAASTPLTRGTCGRDPFPGHARPFMPFRAPTSPVRAERAASWRTSSPAGAPRNSSRERVVRARASVPGLQTSSGSAAVPFPGSCKIGGHAGKAGARGRPETPRAARSAGGVPPELSGGEARPDWLPVAARQRRTPEAQAEGRGAGWSFCGGAA